MATTLVLPHPRIGPRDYARRRRELMALMGEGSIAIVPSARQLIRNRDSSFPFRQDSDFHYLCGFDEPESVLVLAPGRRHGEFLLFCRERDRERENWDGLRAGPEGACELYGADDAFPIGDLDDILPGLIEGRERLYYAMGKQPEFDHQLMSWINKIRAKARTGAHPPGEFLDLDHILHELRLYKSAEELRVMQRAGAISAAAHVRAMRACKPGMFEYQLEAELLHEFLYHGARAPAYSSIVGGGANGCIMHYVENSAPLRAGDLVLIDAGCEYEHYAADVTRTFPVKGRFSAPQQALYEVVLEAQLAAIREVKPGQHWNQPHDVTVRVITEGLRDLGLLDGEPSELIELAAYRTFYMHRAGHWLGLDVHDVGDYKIGGEWRVLEPGMVLTVEPGIYIAPDNRAVAKKWRGIGIRIEDDVVVTKTACKVLTAHAPKSVQDIEHLMAGRA
jgi:Xaa-Pro aminopeptidase